MSQEEIDLLIEEINRKFGVLTKGMAALVRAVARQKGANPIKLRADLEMEFLRLQDSDTSEALDALKEFMLRAIDDRNQS